MTWQELEVDSKRTMSRARLLMPRTHTVVDATKIRITRGRERSLHSSSKSKADCKYPPSTSGFRNGGHQGMKRCIRDVRLFIVGGVRCCHGARSIQAMRVVQ